MGNTAITVDPNATFDPAAGTSAGSNSSGTPGAALTLQSGSTLDLADGTVGTFTLTGQGSSSTALTLSNATLDFDMGSSSADELWVNGGTASVSGVNTINISAASGVASLTPGTYTLINVGGGGTFALGSSSITVGPVTYTLSLGNSSGAGDPARPPPPPAAPGNLTAVAVKTSAIDLTWTAPPGPVTGYNIYRGTSSGAESVSAVATVSGSSTSYDDTGLTAGTSYFYTVEAVDTGVAGNPSAEATATTLPPNTLYWDPLGNTKTVVVATGAGLGGTTGTWSASAEKWFDPDSGQVVAWNSADTAVFCGTPGTVSVSGTVDVPSIDFQSSGYAVQADQAGGSLALAADGGTIKVASADTATISSAISSASGVLTKTGSGGLTLSGTNNYGATAIIAGTLQIGSGGSTGSLGGGAVTDDGSLVFDCSGSLIVNRRHQRLRLVDAGRRRHADARRREHLHGRHQDRRRHPRRGRQRGPRRQRPAGRQRHDRLRRRHTAVQFRRQPRLFGPLQHRRRPGLQHRHQWAECDLCHGLDEFRRHACQAGRRHAHPKR